MIELSSAYTHLSSLGHSFSLFFFIFCPLGRYLNSS